MPASDDYLNYVLGQLECTGPVISKIKFGGVGLYLKGVFFALIADDALYFKVDILYLNLKNHVLWVWSEINGYACKKFEARNPKHETISNYQNSNDRNSLQPACFEFWSF